jgi:hypothetical protein
MQILLAQITLGNEDKDEDDNEDEARYVQKLVLVLVFLLVLDNGKSRLDFIYGQSGDEVAY